MIPRQAKDSPRPRVGVKPPPGEAVGGCPGRWPELQRANPGVMSWGVSGATHAQHALCCKSVSVRFDIPARIGFRPVNETHAAHRHDTDRTPTACRRPKTADLPT